MNPNNASRRTFQEVHRDSKPIGSVEAELWKPTDMGVAQDALEAARLYEKAHKQKGRRNGPLGSVGLEVLHALWSVVDYATGRLEPSIEWLMAVTRRCRDAIVTALKRLAFCGFVKWVRRFAYTGQTGVRGPQVRQVTNAYALSTPADAAALTAAAEAGPPRLEARGCSLDDLRLAIARGVLFSATAVAAATRNYRQYHYRDADDVRGFSKALKSLILREAERESVTPFESRSKDSLRDAPKGAGAR
jgi:hypothetical protein